MKKKIKYVEPAKYFPKEIRQKFKLGEFSEEEPKNEANNANI